MMMCFFLRLVVGGAASFLVRRHQYGTTIRAAVTASDDGATARDSFTEDGRS
jgi:hypothetical protein